MKRNRTWTFLVLVILISSAFSAAQSEQVLYPFTSADYTPGGVIFDNQGNLYGVATGAYGTTYGRVFELSPSANGWIETVLYTFTGGTDGYGPSETESLAFDAAGNLYGTTVRGGKGEGTVFRLTPVGAGKWTESVIHSFLGTQGSIPETGVTIAAGKLFGTTTVGTVGSIFEMSPQLGYRVIHQFGRVKNDGAGPMAAVTVDSAGNVYGTTYKGGAVGCGLGGLGCGTVFKLTPTSSGGWRYKQIYSFQGGSDGARPYGGVVIGPTGIVYGTTWLGGIGTDQCFSNAPGCGTVFELSPNTDGSYTHTVIYTFLGPPSDGGAPQGLILDPNGTLFGTTQFGGPFFSSGTVFELVPQGNGWQETVLHSFGQGNDGALIDSQPIMDSSGNIYGTTYSGGANGYGTVFEVTP